MLRTKQLFFADVFPEGLQLYFIKKKLKQRCFLLNNAKFLRTAAFTEHPLLATSALKFNLFL